MLNVRFICHGTLKEDYLRMACAEYMKRLGGYCRPEILEAKDNVEFIVSHVVDSIISEGGAFKGIVIKNADTGATKPLYCDGMFVAIGLIPSNDKFSDLAKLNEWGYFDSGEDCTTATPGVFVAGDCRSKRIRQITTATADGAVAALAACRYLEDN